MEGAEEAKDTTEHGHEPEPGVEAQFAAPRQPTVPVPQQSQGQQLPHQNSPQNSTGSSIGMSCARGTRARSEAASDELMGGKRRIAPREEQQSKRPPTTLQRQQVWPFLMAMQQREQQQRQQQRQSEQQQPEQQQQQAPELPRLPQPPPGHAAAAALLPPTAPRLPSDALKLHSGSTPQMMAQRRAALASWLAALPPMCQVPPGAGRGLWPHFSGSEPDPTPVNGCNSGLVGHDQQMRSLQPVGGQVASPAATRVVGSSAQQELRGAPWEARPATAQEAHAADPAAAEPVPRALGMLQEASWQVAPSAAQAEQAVRAAWDQHCRLPGGRPELMGAMPAVWLLLPGTGEEPQAAGALMARVQLPPPWLQPDAQHALLQAGKGLDWTLRVLVYSRQGGAAMLRRDWLLQAEWRLYLHPRYRVPTWDSGDGWKLLFPCLSSDTSQAQLFVAVVRLYGGELPSAQPPYAPARPAGNPAGPQGLSALLQGIPAGSAAGLGPLPQQQPPVLPAQAGRQRDHVQPRHLPGS